MGSIPDGLYQTFGDTLRILATAPGSLRRLASVLRSAERRGKDRDATAAAIETAVPELAGLAGGLRQVKGWTLHQWVMVVLALIAILLKGASSDAPSAFTVQQVEQLFDEFIQSHPVLAPTPQVSLPPASTAPTAPSVVRPNDRCPCGSGNRYRHCHGVHVLRDR